MLLGKKSSLRSKGQEVLDGMVTIEAKGSSLMA